MKLRVGVCEAPADLSADSDAWRALRDGVAKQSPDFFLLNEMPFGAWVAAGERFEEASWRRALDAHERGLPAIADLGARAVATSRPFELDGRRVNEAVIWSNEGALRGVHTKQYFPDEPGYYEARWFEPGPRHFEVAPLSKTIPLRVGFLICTELMFNEHARAYGRNSAQVILVPRAVGEASLRRWLVALRMAAIVSGCYVLSSNRSGVDPKGQRFGGKGWIVDPSGDVVAETTETTPVVFHELDTAKVEEAQAAYPCYVKENG